MPQHSANEQYLLELINAERAKAGVQPLAFDNDLSESAEGHSQWMLAADVFSHTGSGGSTSTQRMKAAGYTLQGSWATGENIAWATTRAPTGYQDEVKLLHTNLMNSAGHRKNLLSDNFREVGLGVEVGDYRGRSSAFVTENFAKTGSDVFLTGVAFDDRDNDRFYDPGEGMSGITVTARNSSGVVFKTTTMDAGGYDLALKPGTYTVTFSGPGIATSTQSVSIGSKNVKRDLVDPNTTATLSADTGAADPAPVVEPTPAPVVATEPTPAPAAIPVVDATPTPVAETPDGGGNAAANPWLAEFLKRTAELDSGASTPNLPGFDEGGAVPGGLHLSLAAALNGEQLRFHPSVETPANHDEINDLFDGILANPGGLDAVHSPVANVPAGIDVSPLDADSGNPLAKILAQISAGSIPLNADLLI